MTKRPQTIQVELRTDKPYSTARQIIPVLPDGTSRFDRIVNRDAIFADVQVGDTIESLINRKREIVIGVAVLDCYED